MFSKPKLSRFLLGFETKQLGEAYRISASERLQESKCQWVIWNLSVKFIVSLLVMMASESDTLMKMLCALSLLCLLFILFAQIFTSSYSLQIIAEFISFACTQLILIRSSTTTTITPGEETSTGISQATSAYLAGLTGFLSIVDSGHSPIQKAIVLIVFTALFAVKYEFGIVAWFACSFIILHTLCGLHGDERQFREAFLQGETKKRSLKAWEKFLDRYISEPVFVVEQNQNNNNNSTTMKKTDSKSATLKQKYKESAIANSVNRFKDKVNRSLNVAASAALSVASGGGSPTNSNNPLKKQRKHSLPIVASQLLSPSQGSGGIVAGAAQQQSHNNSDITAKKRANNDILEQRAELFIAEFGSEQKMILGAGGEVKQQKKKQSLQGNELGSPAGIPAAAETTAADNRFRSSSTVVGAANSHGTINQSNVIFQNLGCQQHFYSQVNQTSYLTNQLKQIYVSNSNVGAGLADNLLMSGAIHNLQGGSAMLSSVVAAVSAVAAAGGGASAPIGNVHIDAQQHQQQQQLLGKISLAEYLQNKLIEVFGDSKKKNKKNKNRFVKIPSNFNSDAAVAVSDFGLDALGAAAAAVDAEESIGNGGSAAGASDASRNSKKKQMSAGEDAFEVCEIEVLENCERFSQSGFHLMVKQTYSVHILKVLFHGKQGLMVCLKETTNQRIAADLQVTNAHKEKLLKSMLRQAVAPLQRIVNSVENREMAPSTVRSWCVQASSVVDDIVDYWTMLHGGRVELRKETASLASIVEDVIGMYEEEMFARELELACSWEKDDLEFVQTDAHRFKRVLSNLLALTLNHTLHSPIHLSFNYYDTHKQTILVVVSHANSFLSDQVIELLTSQNSLQQLHKLHMQHLQQQQQHQHEQFGHSSHLYPDDDGTHSYKLPPGQILQLLLCVGLIERLGPAGSLNVRKDHERNVEISFRIFSNLPLQQGVIDCNYGGETNSKYHRASAFNESNMPQFISFNRQNDGENHFSVNNNNNNNNGTSELNSQQQLQLINGQSQLQGRTQTRVYSMSMIKRGSRLSNVGQMHDFTHSPNVNQSELMSLRNILSPAFYVGTSPHPSNNNNTTMRFPSIAQIPAGPPALQTGPSWLQTQPHQQQFANECTIASHGMISSIQRIESACLLTDDIMEKCEDKRVSFQGGLRDVVRMSKQDVELNIPIIPAAIHLDMIGGGGAAAPFGTTTLSSPTGIVSNQKNATNNNAIATPTAGTLKFGGSTLTTLNEKFESELGSELDAQLSKQSILLVDSDAHCLHVLSKFKTVEMQIVANLTAALTKIIGRHHHAVQNSNAADLPFGMSVLPFYKLILVNLEACGGVQFESQQQSNLLNKNNSNNNNNNNPELQQLQPHANGEGEEKEQLEQPMSKTVSDVKRVALYLRNVLDRNTPILLMSSVSSMPEVEELQPLIFYLQLPLTIDKLAKVLKISGSMLSTQAYSLPSLLMQ